MLKKKQFNNREKNERTFNFEISYSSKVPILDAN